MATYVFGLFDILKIGGEIDKFLERHPETLYFKALFNM